MNFQSDVGAESKNNHTATRATDHKNKFLNTKIKKIASPNRSKNNKKFSDYILTPQQIEKLDNRAKVIYFKFLHQLLVQLERMQYKSKLVAMNPWKEIRTFIERELDFSVWGESGASTVPGSDPYCIYAGWVSSYITRNGKTFCKPEGVNTQFCPQGKIWCFGPAFDIPAPNGSKHICIDKPNDGSKNLTQLCVDQFEIQVADGNLIKVINRKIKNNSSNPTEKALWESWLNEIRKNVDRIKVVTSKNGVNFEQYCGSGEETTGTTNANQQQINDCAAMKRLFSNLKAEPQGPWFPDGKGIPKDGIPVEHAPPITRLSEAQKKKIENCVEETQSKLGYLACVACGAKFSGEPELENKTIDNWVTLLGVSAHMCDPEKYDTPAKLQNRVINMMRSFSYCTDQEEYPRSKIFTNPTYVTPFLKNNKKFDFSDYNQIFVYKTEDESRYLDTFGFKSDFSSWPIGHKMIGAAKIFCSDDFASGSPAIPQKKYIENSYNLINSAGDQSELEFCGEAIKKRMETSPTFLLCKNMSPQLENFANNTKFCQSMAQACGLDTTVCYESERKCPDPMNDLYRGGGDGGGGGGGAGGTGPGGGGGKAVGNEGRQGGSRSGIGGTAAAGQAAGAHGSESGGAKGASGTAGGRGRKGGGAAR
ncbi:MAG: hypothetical protein K1X29_01895 [Bdellovibrionales bacterium]|nr:hypothetical protein [Bdellovibrionales bacterium]